VCRRFADDERTYTVSAQEPSQEEVVKAVYDYAAGLVKAGVAVPQIENILMEKGLDQESASIIVKNLLALRSKAIKNAGQKNMLYGALWCIGGIIVTAVTFTAASGGGTYIIAWGAIIFGAIQFFRGLSQYNS